jgi:hypothetical protein
MITLIPQAVRENDSPGFPERRFRYSPPGTALRPIRKGEPQPLPDDGPLLALRRRSPECGGRPGESEPVAPRFPWVRTSFAYLVCVPRLRTSFAYLVCVPRLRTSFAYLVCVPDRREERKHPDRTVRNVLNPCVRGPKAPPLAAAGATAEPRRDLPGGSPKRTPQDAPGSGSSDNCVALVLH